MLQVLDTVGETTDNTVRDGELRVTQLGIIHIAVGVVARPSSVGGGAWIIGLVLSKGVGVSDHRIETLDCAIAKLDGERAPIALIGITEDDGVIDAGDHPILAVQRSAVSHLTIRLGEIDISLKECLYILTVECLEGKSRISGQGKVGSDIGAPDLRHTEILGDHSDCATIFAITLQLIREYIGILLLLVTEVGLKA